MKRSATCSLPRATSPNALAAYQAALAIRERLAKSDPENAEWQRDLAVSNERLARISQRG
jgi:hypothetical protein